MRRGVLLALVVLTGCATVTRGTDVSMHIDSLPSGAEVRMSNGLTCTTPCTLKIARKDDLVATFRKPGYGTVHAKVKSRVAGDGVVAGAGNILVGGVIGAGVDIASGAMNELCPNPLMVKLQPWRAPTAQPRRGSRRAAEVAAVDLNAPETTYTPPECGPQPVSTAETTPRS